MSNQMKKIAVLFHANLDDRKGMTNAAINRFKYLLDILPSCIKTDALCTSYYDSKFLRLIRRKSKTVGTKRRKVDGINIDVYYRKFTLIDYLLKFKFKLEPIFLNRQIPKISETLKNYDLVSAHSFLAGEIALDTFKRYGIPYCITWHGSDINSMPFESTVINNKIRRIIENAEVNFFVSKALREKSDEVTKCGKKVVLYNGYSRDFYRYDDTKRLSIRHEYCKNIRTKIVAFVGNLIPVKNADLLPDIFLNIKNEYHHPLEFWIIGDGFLRQAIEKRLVELGIRDDIKLFGNVIHSKMPDLMNCIDLLVLPSKNEGLPLVTVEAIQCGAMVVGSDVGGISEAIGKNNVISLGDDYEKRFANKCIASLNGVYDFYVNDELDWNKTVQHEMAIYSEILNIQQG